MDQFSVQAILGNFVHDNSPILVPFIGWVLRDILRSVFAV